MKLNYIIKSGIAFFALSAITVNMVSCDLKKNDGDDKTPDKSVSVQDDTNIAMQTEKPLLNRFTWIYKPDFYLGCAAVKVANKFGVIDRNGNVIVPLQYDGIDRLQDDYIVVKQYTNEKKNTYKYGLYKNDGREILPCEYDEIHPFLEDMAVIGKADDKGEIKYGFVDKEGVVVVPPAYDSAKGYYNGEGFAVNDRHVYSFDKQGVMISEGQSAALKMSEIAKLPVPEPTLPAEQTPPSEVGPMTDPLPASLTVKEQNGKFGAVDANDDFVISPEYDKMERSKNGLWMAIRDGKFGLFNDKGIEVVIVDQDEIKEYSGFYMVKKGEAISVISKIGKTMVPYLSPKAFDAMFAFAEVPCAEGKKDAILGIVKIR